MAFSSPLRVLALPVLLFACGVAADAAWQAEFYACFVLVVLSALWLAILTALRMLPSERTASESLPVPEEAKKYAILRAVLDQSPTPLLTIERAGRVHALNRTARSLFGADDLIIHAPDALLDGSQRLHHANRNYRIDRIDAQGAGTTRTILALIDIESEERIAEARAMRELLQVLSHEVMNALTPIASLADSALCALDAPSPQLGALRAMIGPLARRAVGLLSFTHSYRELARLPEPTFVPTPLPLLFQDVVHMFHSQWDERVVLETTPAPEIVVWLDHDQVTQALWALLQNGAEAALLKEGPPVVRLSVRLEDRLVLSISDNGPGVSIECRQNIFQLFFTTKAEGSGVGLNLARQIARAHGGDLHLLGISQTTFELSLAIHHL